MKKKHPTEKQADELWHNFHENDEKAFWKKYRALLQKAFQQQASTIQEPVQTQTPPVVKPLSPQPKKTNNLPIAIFIIIIFLSIAAYLVVPSGKERTHEEIATPTEQPKTVWNTQQRKKAALDHQTQTEDNQKQGKAIAQPSFNLLYDLQAIRQEANAFYWCQHEANQGTAIAQHHLGLMYYDSFFKSKYMAHYWFKKGAKQGLPEAQYYLGTGYYLNDREKELACYWLEKSAMQGHQESRYILGSIYKMRKDTISKIRAFYWLGQAAREGDANAQVDLATLFMAGNEVVEKNETKAIYWAARSAMQGNGGGKYLLGVMVGSGGADQIINELKKIDHKLETMDQVDSTKQKQAESKD